MHTRGIISLIPTVLLCLPSLAGGVTLLGNVLLQRRIEASRNGSSLISFGSHGSLHRLATGHGSGDRGLVGLSRSVSQEVRYDTLRHRQSGNHCDLRPDLPLWAVRQPTSCHRRNLPSECDGCRCRIRRRRVRNANDFIGSAGLVVDSGGGPDARAASAP